MPATAAAEMPRNAGRVFTSNQTAKQKLEELLASTCGSYKLFKLGQHVSTIREVQKTSWASETTAMRIRNRD
jgi:hypothetical protein